ncbi:type I-C CRISPR-associated protein Cas8c/Csd1 [Bacillus sp. FJAT-27264]|uniref:type I-C CRISPR-associated protein Cas8c/Csd1 n=1 Tax=Paenibacillus sp. (strain DSM 101736 / FJAT-27264) TaxID=1850362 RepID=UPI000807EF60|nr:type I-C CRISPR-associated protein Cas8c/Csd1 [Bacillus sp. FJAT-27264]OBZ15730.1 type I-C CRISPR-associated protein Cas8c/Csd1 [Bacillus sp. FJAT-27264]
MSWLLNLYETYESNLDRVGIIERKNNDREYTLLPVSHTTQNAHIVVEITEDGEFHSADVIAKEDISTLIPCTEESASRAGSKVAPYPLHDKLSYVAGDFVAYGGKIKKEEPFAAYIKNLEEWANSDYACAKIKSIYNYLSKRRLIQDLVEAKVIFLDENKRLIEKWDKKYEAQHGEKPKLFSLIAGEQESAFIRFNVHSPNRTTKSVWKDPEVYDSFVRFYSHQLGEDDYCYVSGKLLPSTDRHANKIRNAGDKAKLISANDNSGFTFRGRFTQSSDAASISYEVSQKAHNALKWLINRQAKIVDQRVFLVWGNNDLNIPDPTEDFFNLNPEAEAITKRINDTNEVFAREVAKALGGYRNSLHPEDKSDVNILVLDSATTGRLAVLYYRNMDKNLYLDKLIEWHSTCAWMHRYRKNEQGETAQFYGAPSTEDIAFAAYGPNANEKIVKGLMERMLPCIVDGRSIPEDIVRSATHRSSNPVALEKWEWEKTLSITCALINKKERCGMALETENTDRSYLFGRLLAIADVLERRALDADEKRSTNAIRYMNSFSRYPERTWGIIQAALQPHQARLGAKATYYSSLIDEVASKFTTETFNNTALSGKYLLGFYSQRHELYKGKDKNKESKESEETSN